MKATKTSDTTKTKTTSGRVPPPTNSYQNFDSQLNEWSQKLDEFKGKLAQLSTDLQSDASQKIQDLEEKYNAATDRMHELKSQSVIAKDELKIGFEKAWKELLQAFDAARKTFH